jgi:hypothetical protein
MSIKPILLAVAVTLIASGQDDLSSVHEREKAFAKALDSNDKPSLLALTDNQFHVYLTCGSAVRNFSTNISRQDWMDDLSKLPKYSYQNALSNVRFSHIRNREHEVQPDSSRAEVTSDEFWIFRSANGGPLKEHFTATDTWSKLNGTWKLTGRIYAAHPCTDDPFPKLIKPAAPAP